MIAPAHYARGPRGDYSVGRTDLTGRRALVAADEAQARADIIAHSIKELNDPDVPVTIVQIPGRATPVAVPTIAVAAIQRGVK